MKTTEPSEPVSGMSGVGRLRSLARGWWIWVAAAVLLGALGVIAGPIWRSRAAIARIPASVPARPPGKSLPELLTSRLAEAEKQARTPATALAGIEELGRLYHASGFPAEAEACWRLLRAAAPTEARWCYYLADLQRLTGDSEQVAELLTRTAQLNPGYAPAWLRLAELQFKSGQLPAAEQSYRKRLTLVAGDPYARLGLARVAWQQGRRDEARKLIELLVADAPSFPPAQNLYAEMLAGDGNAAAALKQRAIGRDSGRFREAEDPWLDELSAWCFDYEQLCIHGTLEYQTKHGDLGKSCFERAIALRPEAATAYERLGLCYLDTQQPAQARDVFAQGLTRVRQPSALLFVCLASAYRELKQPTEAVRVVREGLKVAGDTFELYDALGGALSAAGEGEAGVKAFQAAVARNPLDTNTNYNLAGALIAVGRLDEAMEALHRSLQLQPTYPPSLGLLARIAMDSSRWEEAVSYLQPLYESHPELPQVRKELAYCRRLTGIEAERNKDVAAAEQQYRAGLTVDPNDAEMQARLGVLYLAQRRFIEAVPPLEAFRRLDPQNPQAALFLGRAYAASGRQQEAKRLLLQGLEQAERAGNTATAQHCRDALQRLP